MSLIDKVLSKEEFKNCPPVLLDIGASGAIHKKWREITKYAVCIAFDADTRDFNPEPEIAKKYKKLYIKNALVTEDGSSGSVNFYLTHSPYCSSLLKPDNERLKKWAFAPLFDLDKVVRLNSTDLSSVLKELNIDRIDWFKSDTQGTDLRLFKSLPSEIQSKVIAVEFEPGILDAYESEDKLHMVLSFMDSIKSFWLSDLIVKGTLRIRFSDFKEIFRGKFAQRMAKYSGKISPGWGEMTYLNTFSDFSRFTKRDILLGWVCATSLGQHGFALELAKLGDQNYTDTIFGELIRHSTSKVRMWLTSWGYFSRILKKLGLVN